MISQPHSESSTLFPISLFSFGFKHGPLEKADMVWDVRFLPNPYWVPELKHYTGLQPEVSSHVLENETGREFLQLLEPLLIFLMEQFRRSGRKGLVLAFGCTGGRHRSVAVAEHVRNVLDRMDIETHVVHRDIEKD